MNRAYIGLFIFLLLSATSRAACIDASKNYEECISCCTSIQKVEAMLLKSNKFKTSFGSFCAAKSARETKERWETVEKEGSLSGIDPAVAAQSCLPANSRTPNSESQGKVSIPSCSKQCKKRFP